jgi:hypothetical protein
MAEAAIAVLAVLVLGAGVVALRAVLDGLRTGLPASIAVLAPLGEGARLLRTRSVGARTRPGPVVAGVLLLIPPLLRVTLLGLDLPGGVAWLVAAEAVWCVGAGMLGRWRSIVLEPPLLLALATPVVAAGTLWIGPVRDLPIAAEAPVAFLLLLVIGGVLQPWAIDPPVDRLGGAARLLAGAGRAAQPVSVAATASVLLLGTTSGWTWFAAAVLAAVLVIGARRFPVLPERRLVRLALAVLLPLAVVQLGIVIALTLLA